VATEAEARKCTKYNSLAATYYFVPVAVETLGPLGEGAQGVYNSWKFWKSPGIY